MADTEKWKPGSFTKNFGWGKGDIGLRALYDFIRFGFDGKVEDVTRDEFKARVKNFGRPDKIPLNFFLFNTIKEGKSYIVADELVFQAVTADYSNRFDKLALFAFNFSYAGRWKGDRPGQRRPAMWAQNYVIDRVVRSFDWDVSRISANDIQRYIQSDSRFTGKPGEPTRKVATNLNYLYSHGKLGELSSSKVERWWVDALFLALDRLIEDRKLSDLSTQDSQISDLLAKSAFVSLSGRQSLEKDLATRHLLALYIACGSRDRFSSDIVRQRTLSIPDLVWLLENDPRPRGAVHPTNPRILKSIPWACAMLAKYAGFEVIGPDELETFDTEKFIRDRTKAALRSLKEKNISPTMGVEELMRLTRGK